MGKSPDDRKRLFAIEAAARVVADQGPSPEALDKLREAFEADFDAWGFLPGTEIAKIASLRGMLYDILFKVQAMQTPAADYPDPQGELIGDIQEIKRTLAESAGSYMPPEDGPPKKLKRPKKGAPKLPPLDEAYALSYKQFDRACGFIRRHTDKHGPGLFNVTFLFGIAQGPSISCAKCRRKLKL